MRLQQIEIAGFKSFAKKASLTFTTPVTAVVGPNGSGKSNVVEAFRFVLGEQSMKSMRGKSGADLIFRGGTGAPKLSRASVSITFDNHDKVFTFQTSGEGTPILFDTITFTREIFADGTSKYLMNGTEIRLKQMVELLASVNIGTSTHHIISQGEADGILRANPRDRREMLEDALGLKLYHFRIRESESKLERTKTHLKEIQSLRRELAPHLKFLQKQVEKVAHAQTIREELHAALLRFLSSERGVLASDEKHITDAFALIEKKKQQLEKTLASLSGESSHDPYASDIEALKRTIHGLTNDRRTLEQKVSKLEGMIEAHRSFSYKAPQGSQTVHIAEASYEGFLNDLELAIRVLREAQTITDAKNALQKFETVLQKLDKLRVSHDVPEPSPHNDSVRDIALELEKVQAQLATLIEKESDAQAQLQMHEEKRNTHFATQQESTAARYQIKQELTEANAELQVLAISKSAFMERKERYDAELKEAGFLFGPSFLHALKDSDAHIEPDLATLKRTIDRLKIRLDEHAGIGNEVVKEFEETQERDMFLARELADIEGSIVNLETLIVDLKKVLDERFTSGVKTINTRFGEFFKAMFGGGSAFLEITIEKKRTRKRAEEEMEMDETEEEEESFERGIDVHVSLPEKKVKELTMLSGGERSLVSVALLFAISQVNPPPFLVLDETDAALDEANSRRYGDMVERLAEYSQLIVVTHNRETMSRANVLYGVTLGSDSGSKLLSIKFDEAVKVAK